MKEEFAPMALFVHPGHLSLCLVLMALLQIQLDLHSVTFAHQVNGNYKGPDLYQLFEWFLRSGSKGTFNCHSHHLIPTNAHPRALSATEQAILWYLSFSLGFYCVAEQPPEACLAGEKLMGWFDSESLPVNFVIIKLSKNWRKYWQSLLIHVLPQPWPQPSWLCPASQSAPPSGSGDGAPSSPPSKRRRVE